MDVLTTVLAAEAALRLGLSRERVVRRIQTRELRGRRDPERGWIVDAGSIEEYLTARVAREKPTAA